MLPLLRRALAPFVMRPFLSVVTPAALPAPITRAIPRPFSTTAPQNATLMQVLRVRIDAPRVYPHATYGHNC